MSILVVRPRAGGGLAAHVDQELEVLAAAGIAVRESATTVQDRPRPRQDLRTLRILRAESAADDLTAVHAHGLRAGALAALAHPRGGPALVVTLHNRTVGSRPVRLIGALLLRILARRARTVLAVSPDLAESARRAGARDVRHAIIPAPPRAGSEPDTTSDSTTAPGSATGTSGGSDESSATGEPLQILVIARLAAQKGLDDLLDAAALLAAAREKVRIRIAGQGPLHEHLHARIRAEQLPVELLGSRDDVPQLLAAADLVVSAARWEGQPVALQEALRAGRAIIATDAGGTRWVSGEAAQLVPVGDSSALAAAISAHRDPAVRARAEEAARRRAETLPTAEDLLTQLREVLGAARP